LILCELVLFLFCSVVFTASADQCDVVAGEVTVDDMNHPMSPSGSTGTGIDPFGAFLVLIDVNDKLNITDQMWAIYWYYEASDYYDNGHYQLALACADTSIERYDRNSQSWTLKGASLYMLGRYNESIECCDEAIHQNPKDGRAWHTKGIALYRLGRYKEAVRSCNRAIEIDPYDFKASQYRQLACAALGCPY
jgi:tetratricopeptide (TPR) repeat protein